MAEEYPYWCPGCGAALIIGSLFSYMDRWPEFLARHGIQNVAMSGGWERLELEHTVPLASPEAGACDAVYVGDLITPDIRCPRCDVPVYDVVRSKDA
jgi:hypothetical protein